MFASRLLAVFALSAPAFADLMWFSDNGCGSGYLSMDSFNCGLGCTQFTDFEGNPTTNVHSVEAGALEPNAQVVLYKSTDCSGDAYAAIGQAYDSSAAEDQCIPSTNDGLGSFEVLVYDSTGGGEACPPGTMSTATTNYPAPTG